MKPRPTFSICIPNYNYGSVIGQTIESVLSQSYPHFEIIISDNASTDNSMEVIKSFKDPRIKSFRNRANIGFAPNLQYATMHARNDFINLLSSDDQMKPGALETYAKVIECFGDDCSRLVLISDEEHFDENGIIPTDNRASRSIYSEFNVPRMPHIAELDSIVENIEIFSGKDVLRSFLKNLRTYAPFLSTIYSRDLWNRVEGYNVVRTVGPDKYFAFKLLTCDPLVVYIPRKLFRYRIVLTANRASALKNLRRPIDDYFYTLEYDETRLAGIGLKPNDLKDSLVSKICLQDGLRMLGSGNYSQAWRLFAFSLASYPGRAIRFRNFYILLFLLALGPIGKWLAIGLYKLYQSRK